MPRLLSAIQLAYLGVFIAACIAVWGYQATYVWPVERCEAHGGWWSSKYRMCATPIPVWRFTGRLPAAPAHASAGPRSS